MLSQHRKHEGQMVDATVWCRTSSVRNPRTMLYLLVITCKIESNVANYGESE